ncbi:hypothetical protein ACSBR2_024447 [Camellia fascicularis]
MAEKVTTMVLKVDLESPCCYKKIKKVLCKFPQIRDQVYDVKKNTVTITIKCCSPEKIREKLWLEGRKIIKCIEIKEPTESKGEEDKPKRNGKDEKNPPPPPLALALLPVVLGYSPLADKPAGICCGPCYGGYGWGPRTCYYYYYGYEKPVTLPPCYGNCGCGCGCGGNRG